MADFQKRIPPIKLLVSREQFNNLIQLLSNNENKNLGELSEQAKKLKEKLLTYSIPRIEEDGTICVDIRFYINEATALIQEFLYIIDGKFNIEADYYSVIEKLKAKRQNQYNNKNV